MLTKNPEQSELEPKSLYTQMFMQFIEVIPDTLKLSNNYWWKLHRSVQFLAATLYVHVAYVGEVQLYVCRVS